MIDSKGLRYRTQKIHVHEMVGINLNGEFNIMTSLASDDFMDIKDSYDQNIAQYYLMSLMLKTGVLPMFLFKANEYKMAILAHPKFLAFREKTNIYFVDKPVANFKEDKEGLIPITFTLPSPEKFSMYDDTEVLDEMEKTEKLMEEFGIDLFFEKIA